MATAMHEESVSNSTNSIPSLPPDSPGSSVSSRMQVMFQTYGLSQTFLNLLCCKRESEFNSKSQGCARFQEISFNSCKITK